MEMVFHCNCDGLPSQKVSKCCSVKDRESPSWVVSQKVIRAIKDNFLSQNGGKEDFNISKPIMNSFMKERSKRDGVVWMSPPMGWLKANFDSSAKGNLGRVGCGGVLRDFYARVMDAIIVPIGSSTSYRVEVSTSLFVVRRVVRNGYQKLWLEDDSLNIINTLNNKNYATWTIEAIIEEIEKLLNTFDNIHISHSYQETNKVANWIANYAISVGRLLMWKDNLRNIEILKELVNFDMNNVVVGKFY